MRQRKAKNMEERLQACAEYMIQPEVKYANISSFNKVWDESAGTNGSALTPDKKYFDDDKELYLEIGCGKGNFIIKKAIANPDKNFLAIEGQETVILRALEKVKELADKADAGEEGGVHLSNLKFMMNFVHSMDDLFEEDQLSGIYLNFSDPWPKARHAKRRLTYRERLHDYAWALKKGGFVEFKTDNDGLYDSALEEIEATGYEITEQTRDLHNSEFESRLTTTEYEDRFRERGKNINYVKIVV